MRREHQLLVKGYTPNHKAIELSAMSVNGQSSLVHHLHNHYWPNLQGSPHHMALVKKTSIDPSTTLLGEDVSTGFHQKLFWKITRSLVHTDKDLEEKDI